MKKLVLIILCIFLVSCANSPKDTGKNDGDSNKPNEQISDVLTIEFLGYKQNYLYNLKHFMFHYNYDYVDSIDCEGDEAYLIVPKGNQKIIIESYDDQNPNKKSDKVYKTETDFHNEPFILLCNPSELHSNIKITVNDKYSFSPSISLKDGEFDRPENTEGIDYSYEKSLYKKEFDVITSIVNTTFDTVDLSNYSITMDDSYDLILRTTMFNQPKLVGYDEEIFDASTAEYTIPLDLLESWTIILFADYTGELPKLNLKDPIKVDYEVFRQYNKYELCDIKNVEDYTLLLYKGQSIDYEFLTTYVIVWLETSGASFINYRIVDVEAPAG